MMNHNFVIALGALFGGLSVAIGAFAAHGLKAVLDARALAWVDTGAQYQMYHALVILILGFALKQWPGWRQLVWAASSFAVGILLFSGSLYTMAATQITALGIITPFGGLAFLVGWGLLLMTAFRQAK
jgi:uncharacterized membrane protein YgdD (TMEM256/DUF423 family)